MLTARNEFETIPVWNHIAGSSDGTFTDRETTLELIATVAMCTNRPTEDWYRELAACTDNQTDIMFDIQQECADTLNYCAPMPVFCLVTLQDNEWSVQPCLENAQEECDTFEERPKDYQGDNCLVVNDHGNVTCMEWRHDLRRYACVWDMV